MRSKSSDDDARKHVHPMEVENESGEVDPEPKEAPAAPLRRHENARSGMTMSSEPRRWPSSPSC